MATFHDFYLPPELFFDICRMAGWKMVRKPLWCVCCQWHNFLKTHKRALISRLLRRFQERRALFYVYYVDDDGDRQCTEEITGETLMIRRTWRDNNLHGNGTYMPLVNRSGIDRIDIGYTHGQLTNSQIYDNIARK